MEMAEHGNNQMGAAPQVQVQVEGDPPREWHRLPRSILQRVFQRLGPDDYFSASQVCPGWFGAAMEDPDLTQLPMLLLLSHRPIENARFHCLVDHRRYEIPVAELDPAVCRGATRGWLLIEQRGGIVCVLNMMHGAHVYLPTHKPMDMAPPQDLVNLTPAQRRHRYPGFTMAIMSAVPSDPSCAVAAVVGKNRLVVCKLADMRWVLVADCDKEEGYLDLVHHGGCFYALEADNSLTVFEGAPSPRVRRIEAGASCADYNVPPAVDKYLVESLGELLLVENTLNLRNYARVFKLDKHRPRWIPVLVDIEWSCNDAAPPEAAAEVPEPDDAGDSEGDTMSEEMEVDKSVRGRLLLLGRGTSRSLPSDGFPDVMLDAYNWMVVYSLRTDETTLILPRRGCDGRSELIWVTPNPRP